MRVILFDERFVEMVMHGRKRQTIRKQAGCEIWDVLSLRRWTGVPYRSKQEELCQCRCLSVLDVEVRKDGIASYDQHLGGVLSDMFAQFDGFENFDDMRDWFASRGELPFAGQLIRWYAAGQTPAAHKETP